MRKIIRIGFPIVCVAVIGGTFYLLNKTLDRVNELSAESENQTSNITQNVELDNNANNESQASNSTGNNTSNTTNDVNNSNTSNVANNQNTLNLTNTTTQESQVNTPSTSTTLVKDIEAMEAKKVADKEKAIELVKKRDGERRQKVYYTHEGMEEGRYIVAVRYEETTKAVIYYAVDVENEEVKVHY